MSIDKETVYVTISNNRRIPFINRAGPISSPISMLKTVVAMLRKLGFDVKEHTVKVNGSTGNREITGTSDFEALAPGKVVEVNSTPAPAALADAADTDVTGTVVTPSEVKDVDQPTEDEVITETEEKGELDSASEEETKEESEETDLDAIATQTSEEEAVEEEEEELESTDETIDESEELEIYDEAVYSGWSKTLLLNYLRKAEHALPEEVKAELGNAVKARLLEIVVTHIIPLGEESDAE